MNLVYLKIIVLASWLKPGQLEAGEYCDGRQTFKLPKCLHKIMKNHSIKILIMYFIAITIHFQTFETFSGSYRGKGTQTLVANMIIIIRCVLQLEGSAARKVYVLRSTRYLFFLLSFKIIPLLISRTSYIFSLTYFFLPKLPVKTKK